MQKIYRHSFKGLLNNFTLGSQQQYKMFHFYPTFGLIIYMVLNSSNNHNQSFAKTVQSSPY